MIVSHKHKLIFVKTHKTATQTFLKFIKPHLGPDDVMAGDPPFEGKDDENKADTQVNVDKPFATGKCALDYKEKYGNHLPWFMIKEIVGDDIWNNYTKFTIEREPQDRILSLFYFLNPNVVKPGMMQMTQAKKQKHHEDKTLPEMVNWVQQNSLLSAFPEQTRHYFEEWCLAQLESPTLDLTSHETYDAAANAIETKNALDVARKFKLNKLLDLYDGKAKWTNPANGLEFASFPYIDDPELIIWKKPFDEGWPFFGQCRFLNYGNYFDGKELRVDYVVNFKDVGNNLGKMFKAAKIDIDCNKSLYDAAIQNHHFRKNLAVKKDNNWWYCGNKGDHIKAIIKRRFYNDNMNEKQINFNKIITN